MHPTQFTFKTAFVPLLSTLYSQAFTIFLNRSNFIIVMPEQEEWIKSVKDKLYDLNERTRLLEERFATLRERVYVVDESSNRKISDLA